jgi:hypothetical protein
MLTIHVPLTEDYDEDKDLFIVTSAFKLELEHSLVSLSKWESKFGKPFLSEADKTAEETIWYIKAMTLTPDVPDEIYMKLSPGNVKEINDYISSKQTATWFKETPNQKKGREVVTGELIYYWMLSLNIDMECQHWHLNKLITLIRVTNEKNQPPKKMSQAEMIRERDRLNEERLAQMGVAPG